MSNVRPHEQPPFLAPARGVRLFLRVFANCESAQVALGLAQRLALAVSRVGLEQASRPRQYWKLPHLYEFTYARSPATTGSFQDVVSGSPGGWEHSSCGSELSSVWNRSADLVFLVPEVSWAEVQLMEHVA